MGRTDRVSRGVDVSIVVGQQGLYVSFGRRVSLKYLVTPSVGIYLVLPVGLLPCMFSTFQANQPLNSAYQSLLGMYFPGLCFCT